MRSLTRVATSLAVAALALTTVAPSPGALAAPSERHDPGWVVVDGDHVIAAEDLRLGTAAVLEIGQGFLTNVDFLDGPLVVRLDHNAAAVRAEVTAAVQDVAAASQVTVTVAAGTSATLEDPPSGEVHVRVAQTSPCGELTGSLLGCGGYRAMSRGDGRGYGVRQGVVWLSATVAADPVRYRSVVAHELGHAFGLSHYDAHYEGRKQVMASIMTSSSPTSYQSGDLRGFGYLGEVSAPAEPPTPTPTPTPPATPVPRFADVVPSAYYATAAGWLRTTGITTGVGGSNYFRPDDVVSRAQMVTFLWRMMGSPKSSKAHGFADVPAGAYYDPAVRWAKATGLTTGVGGTNRFAPNDAVTRAQLVSFLHRVSALKKPTAGLRFTDVASSAWFTTAVRWADQHKITTGVAGSNRFAPDSAVTRGQMAAFLYRTVTAPAAWNRPLPPTAP